MKVACDSRKRLHNSKAPPTCLFGVSFSQTRQQTFSHAVKCFRVNCRLFCFVLGYVESQKNVDHFLASTHYIDADVEPSNK